MSFTRRARASRQVAATATDTLTWWQARSQERRVAMRSGLRVPPSLPLGPTPLSRQLAAQQRLLALVAGHGL